MKKRNIIIASASLLSAMAIGAGIVGISPKAAEVKAEGKTEVLFDIGVNTACGEFTMNFTADMELPVHKWTAFNCFINGEEKEIAVLELTAASETMVLAWAGNYPKDTAYRHYQIKAGTTIFETSDSKYVLRNDYNFWRARLSGGGDGADFVWQHGQTTVSEVPSFSVADSTSGGAQAFANRWLLTANYTKSSEWQVNRDGLWCTCEYFYAMNDSTDYSLKYNTDNETGHFIELAADEGGLQGSTSLTGSEHFIMYFNAFDTTTGTDQFISFYFPKGTLFGGLSSGYHCFLEHDYYITVLKDKIFGSTESTADLIYNPVKSFIDTNMKMGDAAYEGEGTDLCKTDGTYEAAKAAYNALSDNQKFTFCNFPSYADAFNRLTAWATANGETLNSATGEISKSSSFTILGDGDKDNSTLYYAVLAVSALLVITVTSAFYFRKKRHN